MSSGNRHTTDGVSRIGLLFILLIVSAASVNSTAALDNKHVSSGSVVNGWQTLKVYLSPFKERSAPPIMMVDMPVNAIEDEQEEKNLNQSPAWVLRANDKDAQFMAICRSNYDKPFDQVSKTALDATLKSIKAASHSEPASLKSDAGCKMGAVYEISSEGKPHSSLLVAHNDDLDYILITNTPIGSSQSKRFIESFKVPDQTPRPTALWESLFYGFCVCSPLFFVGGIIMFFLGLMGKSRPNQKRN